MRDLLIKEWNYGLNGLIDGYSDFSSKKVWWICSKDKSHKWQAIINNRSKGTGCPYCSGRSVSEKNSLAKHSQLIDEINIDKNNVDPRSIAQFSHKKLWWKCKLGHTWKAEVSSRVSGQGCPYCSGKNPTETNNLLYCFPDLCKEWSEKNGLKPEFYLPFSRKKVFWKCSDGHEWETAINNRTLSGSGCHYCTGYIDQKKCEVSSDGKSKRCNPCLKMKDKVEFRIRKSKGQWINSVCKKCEEEKVLQYRTMTPEGVVSEIIRRKRHECLKKNLPFNLTKKYLLDRLNKNEWKCELTKLPLRAIKTSLDEKYQGFHLDSISIDRVRHKDGYTKDNIRIVLNQVNIFRSSGSDDRMYKIAEELLRHRKRK